MNVILTKYNKHSDGKSRLADENECDSTRYSNKNPISMVMSNHLQADVETIGAPCDIT